MKELIKVPGYEVEWPGWPLSMNPFGDEFDEAARIRMIIGGKRMIPFVIKYQHRLSANILEIGPFFNPLSISRELCQVIPKDSNVFYIENDPFAIAWLRSTFAAGVFDLDMNASGFGEAFQESMFKETGSRQVSLGAVIISQVLNYVDFRHLFGLVYSWLIPGGLLFVNNVTNYGIPPLFSDKRPQSNEELLEGSLGKGFSLVEKAIMPRYFRKEVNDRIILVLEKQ